MSETRTCFLQLLRRQHHDTLLVPRNPIAGHKRPAIRFLPTGNTSSDLIVEIDYGSAAQSYACRSSSNQLEIIKFLVEKGAKVEAKGSVYRTVIGETCCEGDISTVEYLVQHGGNVSVLNEAGVPPIFMACFRQDEVGDMIEKLIEVGATASAEIKDKTSRTVLPCAVLSGSTDAVKRLLAADPQLLDQSDDDGWTALHWATRKAYLISSDKSRSTSGSKERQVDMIPFLSERSCPGLHATVSIGQNRWNIQQIARYFGASEDVQHLLAKALD
ncbi:ankyrin [Acephala macrosclerotiorum]|nr:ankyrin [Acephala macrosclerotiorum]